MKHLLHRHGAFVSGVTGIALVVTLMAQEMAQTATVYLSAWGQTLPSIFLLSLGYALAPAIGFGLGFFVSLWLIAPIAEELRVPHVITRAILATGVGSTVTFVIMAVMALIDSFNPTGLLFGSSFPFPEFDGIGAGQRLGGALGGAISLFVTRLPLGVLAGLLLWIWRKEHPPKRPLEGLIDL